MLALAASAQKEYRGLIKQHIYADYKKMYKQPEDSATGRMVWIHGAVGRHCYPRASEAYGQREPAGQSYILRTIRCAYPLETGKNV